MYRLGSGVRVSASFQKNARLMGRLGSGVRTPPRGRQCRCSAGRQGQVTCWPVDRADVVCTHTDDHYTDKTTDTGIRLLQC